MTPDEILDSLPEGWATPTLREKTRQATRVGQYVADAHGRLAEAQQAVQAATAALDYQADVDARRHLADAERVVGNLPEVPSIDDPDALELAGEAMQTAIQGAGWASPTLLSVEVELPAWNTVPVHVRGNFDYAQPSVSPAERRTEAALRAWRAEHENLRTAFQQWPASYTTLEALRVAAQLIAQAGTCAAAGRVLVETVNELNRIRTEEGNDWVPGQPGYTQVSQFDSPEIRELKRYRERQRQAAVV
jgi:hypothetical protein